MSSGNKFLLSLMLLMAAIFLYSYRYDLMMIIGKALLLEAVARV
jgi:hypothetical protein